MRSFNPQDPTATRRLDPHDPTATRRLSPRDRAELRSFGNSPFRKRIAATVALLALLAALAAGSAYAYFTATVASGGNGGAVAASLPPGNTPEASLSGASVTVTWAQSAVGGQRLGAYAGGGYAVKRYPASGGSAVTPGASCNATIAGATEKLSCTESNVPPGSWKYTVTPVLNHWVGAESAQSAAVTISGVPAGVAVQSGSTQSATVKTSFGGALVALVTDAGGNPVPGVTVTFTAPSSGASGTFENGTASTTATTASNGQATASAFTANTIAGGYTVSASVSGVSASASFSLTNNPGGASSFTVPTPATQMAGTAFEETLTAKDQYGNVASGYTGEKTITFSGPESSPNGKAPSYPASVTFSKGAGKASITLYKAQATTLSAKEGSIGGASGSFAVNSAGVALSYNPTCPASTPKNTPITFTLVVPIDAYGNPFTNNTSIGIGLSLTNTSNWGFSSVGTGTTTVNITTGPSKNTFTVAENGAKQTTGLTATSPAGFTPPPPCEIKSGS